MTKNVQTKIPEFIDPFQQPARFRHFFSRSHHSSGWVESRFAPIIYDQLQWNPLRRRCSQADHDNLTIKINGYKSNFGLIKWKVLIWCIKIDDLIHLKWPFFDVLKNHQKWCFLCQQNWWNRWCFVVGCTPPYYGHSGQFAFLMDRQGKNMVRNLAKIMKPNLFWHT